LGEFIFIRAPYRGNGGVEMPFELIGAFREFWALISSILSDQVKERLKPKTSSERAKDCALLLYANIGILCDRTQDFVEKLRSYADSSRKRNHSKKVPTSHDSLKSASYSLRHAIDDTLRALEAVNPPLHIHNPELSDKLFHYVYSRDSILQKFWWYIDKLEYEDVDTLKSIAKEAEENYQKLLSTFTEFRAFVAKEFSFKELF
jgi:hypothetical protein